MFCSLVYLKDEVTKEKTLITDKQKFGTYIEIHLPGFSDSKEATCNAGYLSSISGL